LELKKRLHQTHVLPLLIGIEDVSSAYMGIYKHYCKIHMNVNLHELWSLTFDLHAVETERLLKPVLSAKEFPRA
jgi:hypothetical protein